LVFLQVTSLLLEGERRKLSVLQRELRGALNREAGSLKAKERQQHELILAISWVSRCCACCHNSHSNLTSVYLFFNLNRRIQSQYDHLEQEYRQTCIGVLRSSNTRGCGKVKIYYKHFVQPLGHKILICLFYYSHFTEQPKSTSDRTATDTKSTGKSKPFFKRIYRSWYREKM